METVAAINDVIHGILWSPFMLIVMMGIGLYFTIRTGFFQVRKIGFVCKATIGETIRKIFSKDPADKPKPGTITPFQALSSALAGTIGTGNIVGVATAIVTGGPGAIFWMWLSAFVGMMSKFAEVALAVHYREKNDQGEWSGGPMFYITKGMGAKWGWLAKAFAVLGALCTFGIGNMTQVNSISSAANDAFGVPTIVTGLIVAALVGLVIIGGINRIASVTEKIVPAMCVLYLIGCAIYLIANAGKILPAFGTIFAYAFDFKSALGGVAGYTVANAARFGVARGVFTNEAGMGSAPIVHAQADTEGPVQQGLYGIFEVFGDTLVMCTITAIVIVSSGLWDTGLSGAPLTAAAFGLVLGAQGGGMFITVCILCFAFATCLGWYFYGSKCFEYLAGTKYVIIYKIAFVIVVVIGAVSSLEVLWAIADTLNAMMMIPNLIALVVLSPVVFKLYNDFVSDKRNFLLGKKAK